METWEHRAILEGKKKEQGPPLGDPKYAHSRQLFSIFQFPIMHSVCPPNFA